MIPWWVLLVALLGYSAIVALVVRLFFNSTADVSMQLGIESGAEKMRRTALEFNRERGPRVQIDVRDFGEEWGEVRWHWTLWDADRYLLPQTQELGCTRPYREGAAPMQGLAYSQALQAIAAMREEAGVDVKVVTR